MERGLAVRSFGGGRFDGFPPPAVRDGVRNARMPGGGLRRDRCALPSPAPAAPEIAALRDWSQAAAGLAGERARLAVRARRELRRYYPQFLGVGSDPARAWVRALWRLAPTPGKARHAGAGAVAGLLERYRVRSVDAGTVLGTLCEDAAPAGADEAAAVARLEAVFSELDAVSRRLAGANRELDRLIGAVSLREGEAGERRDADILGSLPGVGRIVLATLLAEAHDPLQRRDYQALRRLSGVAPVIRRSGASPIVVRRLTDQDRLRDAVGRWAGAAIRHDPVSRAKYAALRARGHGHGRALRGVADRLLFVACAMLENRTLFDPALGSRAHAA